MVILIAISTAFVILQNVVGMTAANLYGLEPLVGVLAGSVSLVGGVGNTVGLISACLIGGPIAQRLLTRHKIEGTHDSDLEVGALRDSQNTYSLDYYDVLRAIFLLNVVIGLGYAAHLVLTEANIVMPLFVPVLIAGIIIINVGRLVAPKADLTGRYRGIALISDISLGIFLTMALMSMDLLSVWSMIGFVALVMTLQILLAIVYAYFVVFWAMGRDYDATVVQGLVESHWGQRPPRC